MKLNKELEQDENELNDIDTEPDDCEPLDNSKSQSHEPQTTGEMLELSYKDLSLKLVSSSLRVDQLVAIGLEVRDVLKTEPPKEERSYFG